jgi:tyrosine-protein kinase Etk/Wzc
MNKDLFYRYSRYWYLFLFFLVLSFAVAFMYLRYATPEYLITSSILIKDDHNDKLFEGEVFDKVSSKPIAKNIEDEIEFFKSYSLIERVMESLSMETSFYTKGRFKNVEIYGDEVPVTILINRIVYNQLNSKEILQLEVIDDYKFKLTDQAGSYIYNWGQEINRPAVSFEIHKKSKFTAPNKPIIVKFNNLPKLAKSYVNTRMNVSTISKTGNVLLINVTEPIKQRGIDILNTLIATYNLEGVEYKNKKAANALSFIGERLKSLTNELSGVERNVEVYKQQNRITDVSSNAQSYIQSAGDYSKQLVELELQINKLNSLENYLKNPSNQNELVPSTLGISDGTLTDLIGRLSDLQLERQRQLRTVQAGNPIVVNIDEQIAATKVSIQENVRNIKNMLILNRNNLKATSSKFESKIYAVPSIEKALVEIQRQQGIKENLYLFLLQKREESALSLASAVSNARVIDNAVPNDLPTKPKKQLTYLIAFIMGLGLPFSLLYTRDLLSNNIQTISDVKNLSTIPILGEISHNTSKDAVVVKKGSNNVISELFRLIRTNLKFSTHIQDDKVCLITSSNTGEGKTFFTVNLGASIALTNKKVVLLEFDLRKPELLSKLGMESKMGLSDYLTRDGVQINDIILPTSVDPNLFVISAGAIPTNPSEILTEYKLSKLINELKSKFDYVLIDTSPIGKVADAYSIAPYTDLSIFLVRYNYTKVSQLEVINEISANTHFTNSLLVLNDARRGNSQGYSYGYKGIR